MNKEDIIRKLTSRKLWTVVASFVTLVLVAVGFPKDSATQVAAIIMAGASVIAYIVGEGLIDASRNYVVYEDEEEGEE